MNSKLLNSTVKILATAVLALGISSKATAQTCPAADKLTREAAVIDLDCNARKNLVALYAAQIAQIDQNIAGASTTFAKSYRSEKTLLTGRQRTASGYVTRVCTNLLTLKQRQVDAARARCRTTGTGTGTGTGSGSGAGTGAGGSTGGTGVTAYCPLGVTNVTNAGGKVTTCKRGKLFNGGCWYVEEEYHDNKNTFDQALANPRLAILWSGASGNQFQINFAYLLAGITESACRN
jgi:hypothetical protein